MTVLEKILEWKKKNPDAVKIHAKTYRDKNPQKNRACVDRYRENNIEEIRLKDRLRKAEKRKKELEEYDKTDQRSTKEDT